MGAADGSIFSRHNTMAGDFDVPYLKGGAEEGLDPVLFLHGLGGAGKWEAFHMAMGTVALTYVPQLPGWQEGQAPEGIVSVQDYADLAVGFLDSLGIDRVILGGHSIGAWIALRVAAAHPDRVSRLILANAMGLDVPEAPAANLGEMDEESFAKAAFGRLGLIATAQPDGFGAEWENVRRGPEFERQWKGRGLVAGLIEGPCSDPELTNQVRSISNDTLLVWGRLDGITPIQHGDALRAAMPNSRLDVIERCGHLPMSEKPETFNRIIRNYLVDVDEEIPEVVKF